MPHFSLAVCINPDKNDVVSLAHFFTDRIELLAANMYQYVPFGDQQLTLKY